MKYLALLPIALMLGTPAIAETINPYQEKGCAYDGDVGKDGNRPVKVHGNAKMAAAMSAHLKTANLTVKAHIPFPATAKPLSNLSPPTAPNYAI